MKEILSDLCYLFSLIWFKCGEDLPIYENPVTAIAGINLGNSFQILFLLQI